VLQTTLLRHLRSAVRGIYAVRLRNVATDRPPGLGESTLPLGGKGVKGTAGNNRRDRRYERHIDASV
jgi:hypothetical protein